MVPIRVHKLFQQVWENLCNPSHLCQDIWSGLSFWHQWRRNKQEEEESVGVIGELGRSSFWCDMEWICYLNTEEDGLTVDELLGDSD